MAVYGSVLGENSLENSRERAAITEASWIYADVLNSIF